MERAGVHLVDVIVPAGKYSERRPVNAGNNAVSINPYYAFTFVATDKLEFSGQNRAKRKSLL
jgi:hypothetical protein